MSESVRAGGAPASGRVRLRPVVPEDEEFLLAVYASTRADEMTLVTDWTEEQKTAFLAWQLRMQREQYEARFPTADYSVILLDDEPVGRLWVARVPEQIRLLDIAILPAYQNRGVGTYLFKQLIEEASRARKPLRHMVFKLNEGGIRFYERLGFRPIEEFHMYIHLERLPHAADEDNG